MNQIIYAKDGSAKAMDGKIELVQWNFSKNYKIGKEQNIFSEH